MQEKKDSQFTLRIHLHREKIIIALTKVGYLSSLIRQYTNVEIDGSTALNEIVYNSLPFKGDRDMYRLKQKLTTSIYRGFSPTEIDRLIMMVMLGST